MKASIALVVVAAGALCAPAFAGPISYSFTNGGRSASVTFSMSGSDLVVDLSNTSLSDALVPTDILTGVFFEIVGNPLLGTISAKVPVGNEVYDGGTNTIITPGDRVVGGEWAYKNSIVAVPPNNEGISSSGLTIFGSGDLFPGPDLEPPPSPDGVQYGITTAGDNLLTGNGGITGTGLIKSAVQFKLSGFVGEPDALIAGAYFQYGTSLDEPGFQGGDIPEPTSVALLAIGMATIVACRRRFKTK
ncbi:MAG TPA: XDD4 family exosortase-dependent surface protein [Pirellulales bacterium]|nr:XDD4 family exosortase-dependent surface protein [Pirellulales bacterium]